MTLSKKESLQEYGSFIRDKIKFYYTILLALFSALTWSVYALLEKKADEKLLILFGVGSVLVIFVIIRLKGFYNEQEEIIEKLEKDLK